MNICWFALPSQGTMKLKWDMRRVWPFSAKTDWPDYWWDSRRVSGGCLMLIDNCVASEPHLLFLHIEQFVMAQVPKLRNGCKSNEKNFSLFTINQGPRSICSKQSSMLNFTLSLCSIKACHFICNQRGLVQMLDLFPTAEMSSHLIITVHITSLCKSVSPPCAALFIAGRSDRWDSEWYARDFTNG